MAIVREKHLVTTPYEGLRLQEYAPKVLTLLPTRAGVKKAIKRGEILIDGKPSSTARIMQAGMVLELLEGNHPSSRTYQLELPILYEDTFLAIINKPAGIPVSGNQFKTIQNSLVGVITHSTEKDALPIPLPAHRLDALTSGILLIAKTTKARIALGQLFEEKKIQKTYQAIVIGETDERGEMHFPIEGKESFSSYQKISSISSLKSGTLTLLELTPHTGRTHQLRIHCALAGFPIAGDTIHGNKEHTILHKGLFLTATKITLPHPISGEKLSMEIELPKKFERYLQGEEKRFEKWG